MRNPLKSRWTAVLTAGVLSLGVLTACGSSSETTAPTAAGTKAPLF